MRLYIPSVDDSNINPEDVRVSELLQGLQRKVSERYRVCGVDSCKASEEFQPDYGGDHERAVHGTFGYYAVGRITNVALVQSMCTALWSQLRVWPEGSVVIWRRRPLAEEYEESEFDLDSQGQAQHAPEWRVRVTLRIGCVGQEAFGRPDGVPLSRFGA